MFIASTAFELGSTLFSVKIFLKASSPKDPFRYLLTPSFNCELLCLLVFLLSNVSSRSWNRTAKIKINIKNIFV